MAAAPRLLATSTSVAGPAGDYPALPGDQAPRSIAQVAGPAVAALSADGRQVFVAASPSAAWSAVELPSGLVGLALQPLATLRAAVPCYDPAAIGKTPAADAHVTHVCLVDCAAPLVEVHALPGTATPVQTVAPLSHTTFALFCGDGVVDVWSPDAEVPLKHNVTPRLARAAFVWYDPAAAVNSTNPAALHGFGWLRSSDADNQAPLVTFSIGANGELLGSESAPSHVAELLAVADFKTYGVPVRSGALIGGATPSSGFVALGKPLSDPAEGAFPAALAEFLPTGDAGSAEVPSPGVVVAPTNANSEFPDACPICFDDIELGDESACALDCGHVLHRECLEQCLARAEEYLPKGHRIVFNMANCPSGCGRLVRHPCFAGSTRIVERYAKVVRDVAARAVVDYPGHSADEVMGGYLHYVCGTCGEPYWGGSKDCAAMMSGEVDVDPRELQCWTCARGSGAACEEHPAEHGAEWLFHKCSFCCNIATDFSLGRLWLCDACIQEKRTAPVWAAGDTPCVGPDACPLGGHHKATSRAPVGCLLCYLAGDRIEQSKVRQPSAEPPQVAGQ